MDRIEKLFRRLEALLHHPAESALDIKVDPVHSQVDKAEHLTALFGGQYNLQFTNEVEAADQVAAGANEYNFPDEENQTPFLQSWLEAPILKHPLSGATHCVSGVGEAGDCLPIASVDVSKIKTEIAQLLQDLQPEQGDEEAMERLTLKIWRSMPDLLASKVKGVPWHVLPAEPRIPDHPIWEHLSLTSALAGGALGAVDETGENQNSEAMLLLMAIGPVQGFVGAARKSRDLQAGSFMLSYLTWHAIKAVCEKLGPESMLFPDLKGQPLTDKWLEEMQVLQAPEGNKPQAATIPNRFFAVAPASEVADVACAAEDALREEFGRICAFTVEQLKKEAGEAFLEEVAWDEILSSAKNYFECYWVALPLHQVRKGKANTFKEAFETEYASFLKWDDTKANEILEAFEQSKLDTNVGACYGRLYRLTEALMGSRKSMRDFQQFPEHGYRCSLIPSLAAIAPKVKGKDGMAIVASTPGPKEVKLFWRQLATRLPHSKLTEGEQFSLVALTKRFLPDYLEGQGVKLDAAFPSTGSFAAADFKEAVINAGDKLRGHVDYARAGLNKVAYRIKRNPSASPREVEALFLEEALPKLRSLAAGDELYTWFSRLDGRWLFAESFDLQRIQKEYMAGASFTTPADQADFVTAIAEAKSGVLQLIQAAKNVAAIPAPSKYYVLLHMDGDNMGKWLSGQQSPAFGDALHNKFKASILQADAAKEPAYVLWKRLVKSDHARPLTPALHLAISRSLGTFALHLVQRLVEEEHLGRLVYSGGDDVLAFVSFGDALKLARKLRAAFTGQIEEVDGQLAVNWDANTGYVALDGQLWPTMGHTASASVGLALAHYKHGLQQVVKEAHDACEVVGKDRIGRNALGITVLKRSGERFQTGTKWHQTEGAGVSLRVKVDIVSALEKYATLVEGGWVASSYIYDLELESEGLVVFDGRDGGEEEQAPQNLLALRAEMLRLFRRRTEKLKKLRNPAFQAANVPPDWLAAGADATDVDWQRNAFDQTVALLLQHNHLTEVIMLLDAAQFLGRGGDQ